MNSFLFLRHPNQAIVRPVLKPQVLLKTRKYYNTKVSMLVLLLWYLSNAFKSVFRQVADI